MSLRDLKLDLAELERDCEEKIRMMRAYEYLISKKRPLDNNDLEEYRELLIWYSTLTHPELNMEDQYSYNQEP